jgi:hypothetical protein
LVGTNGLAETNYQPAKTFLLHTITRSNLFVNFWSKILSPRAMRVNSKPKPSGGDVPPDCICPHASTGHFKWQPSFVPTGGGSGVELNSPPMP